MTAACGEHRTPDTSKLVPSLGSSPSALMSLHQSHLLKIVLPQSSMLQSKSLCEPLGKITALSEVLVSEELLSAASRVLELKSLPRSDQLRAFVKGEGSCYGEENVVPHTTLLMLRGGSAWVCLTILRRQRWCMCVCVCVCSCLRVCMCVSVCMCACGVGV